VTPEIDGIVVHRCRRIDPVDIVDRPDGIRLTSPPRSLFDSADMLGLSVARSVMEQILHEELCTLGTITDTFARLAHPNRPGSRTMAEVIASRPTWRQALHSDLEQRVLVEIERQLLPSPVTQCPVQLPMGRVIHLDFGWPEWRVGLEVDDPAWHAGFEERHRDMGRDRKAAMVGWSVSRVSKIDVESALRDAIGDIATIIRARSLAA
jgi:very-short-patch-repair endonuclease